MADNGDLAAQQHRHWQRTYTAHPDMYGQTVSAPGAYAIELWTRHHVHAVLELGAGHGRDTLAFLRAGFQVTALDFAEAGITQLQRHATDAGRLTGLDARVHDIRQYLPLPDTSVDAVYSHMLLCMAFTTRELDGIAGEIDRVLRPGGWHVYTVRHTGDPHYRAGTGYGDDIWEHGGFAVHYFDDALVDQLARGHRLVERAEFCEGNLPRHLWRLTLHKPAGTADAPPS